MTVKVQLDTLFAESLAVQVTVVVPSLNVAPLAGVQVTVTLASPDEHPLAKSAKDVAAASVLVGAIVSVAIGLFLLGPRLVARFFGP